MGGYGHDNNRGVVYIYSYNGSEWFQRGSDIDGENFSDALGFSLDLSKDATTVAIGSLEYDNSLGAVGVYKFDGVDWEMKGETFFGSEVNEGFSFSLALSNDGNKVAIGATLHDEGKGTIQVYEYLDSNLSLNKNKLTINAFKVFPNPTVKELNINTSEVTIKKVSIFNTKGVLVLTEKFNDSEVNFNVQNLTIGSYFAKIETENGEITKQFIKE